MEVTLSLSATSAPIYLYFLHQIEKKNKESADGVYMNALFRIAMDLDCMVARAYEADRASENGKSHLLLRR